MHWQKVCETLLRKGPLTLRLLIRFTELTPSQVNNSLLILIQHNCVQAFTDVTEGREFWVFVFSGKVNWSFVNYWQKNTHELTEQPFYLKLYLDFRIEFHITGIINSVLVEFIYAQWHCLKSIRLLNLLALIGSYYMESHWTLLDKWDFEEVVVFSESTPLVYKLCFLSLFL